MLAGFPLASLPLASVGAGATTTDAGATALGTGATAGVTKTVPDLPQVGVDPSQLRRFLDAVREVIQTREGRRGNVLDKGVTFRELVDLGLIELLATGFGAVNTGDVATGPPGPPGVPGADGDPYVPDYTAPPTPTGLAAVSLFRSAFIEWDAPVYTVGHGNAYTTVYVAQYGGTGPLPTFANALAVGRSASTASSYVHDAAMGAQLHIWATFTTEDAVEGSPGGGLNGVQITIGKVGNSDLGPLIVEADNLASGAVTAAKLAALSVELTKFASGIEPVGIVAGVPGVLTTRAIVNTVDGKLYRWTGAAYEAAVSAADITGKLTDAQIADLAATKLTGTITQTQIADDSISTPKLVAGAVTTLKLAALAVTADILAANSVTAPKVAANAITTNALDANAVTAAKIAAGAITTTQLAAGAVTTSKLTVTGGGYVNPDPLVQDSTAWSFSFVTGANPAYYLNWNDGPQMLSAWDKNDGGTAWIFEKAFPISSDRTYLLEASIWSANADLTHYFSVSFLDVNGNPLVGTGWPASGAFNYFGILGTPYPAGKSTQSIAFGAEATAKIPAGAAFMRVGVLGAYNNAPGRWAWGGGRVREMAAANLIVDGAIIATKIAANAIAVGSAAIADGAIRRAMIETLAVDTARIADLAVSGAKIAIATITDAQIASLNAVKITAGTLSADRIAANSLAVGKLSASAMTSGQYIRSEVYTPGSAGWTINSDGTAEFGAATIRGKLVTAQLEVGAVSQNIVTTVVQADVAGPAGVLTVDTRSITSVGRPLRVSLMGYARARSTLANTTFLAAIADVRLYRGATLLCSLQVGAPAIPFYLNESTSGRYSHHNIALDYLDSPPAGSHSYSAEVSFRTYDAAGAQTSIIADSMSIGGLGLQEIKV